MQKTQKHNWFIDAEYKLGWKQETTNKRNSTFSPSKTTTKEMVFLKLNFILISAMKIKYAFESHANMVHL